MGLLLGVYMTSELYRREERIRSTAILKEVKKIRACIDEETNESRYDYYPTTVGRARSKTS